MRHRSDTEMKITYETKRMEKEKEENGGRRKTSCCYWEEKLYSASVGRESDGGKEGEERRKERERNGMEVTAGEKDGGKI